MKSLSNLLLKRKANVKLSLTDKDIFYVFNRVIKEEFGNYGAAKLLADYYKDKVIFVRSTSSNWASELFSNRGEIVDKINKELGEKIIREIKMK
jgi:hypothetical protein